MTTNSFQPARMSDDLQYVIDSDSNRLRLDDPRVVHVWTANYYRHASSLLSRVLTRRGWRVRIGPSVGTNLLRKAKQVCSGKECPGLNAIVGAAVQDIEQNRRDDEVTLYYDLDCLGPCPAGAWPVTCGAYLRKLGLRNIVFPGHPAVHNNYMGQGIMFGWELFSAFAIADILAEAESALRCAAEDPESALAAFDDAVAPLCDSIEKGLMAFEGGVKRWTESVARIPLRASVASLPKVLMLGGGNAIIFHQLLIEYFARQGVLVKPSEMTDFILHVDADLSRLVAFEAAQTTRKQFAIGTRALAALGGTGNGMGRKKAFIHAINIKAGGSSLKKFRKIARQSGLLFGDDVSFADSIMAGDGTIPDQLMLEATGAVGRLSLSIERAVYHAALHANCFNCYQGTIAQALLKETASQKEFPFISLEFDGVEFTPHHHTLLETLCFKANNAVISNRETQTGSHA